MLKESTCEFCAEFHENIFPYDKVGFSNTSGPRVTSFECNQSVYLMPDISPVLVGHTLLCTNSHLTSYSKCSDKSTLTSINTIISEFYDINPEKSDVLFFEHGMNSCSQPNGCVDHAHIHIIPLPKNVGIGKLGEYMGNNYDLEIIGEWSCIVDAYIDLQRGEHYNEYVLLGFKGKETKVIAFSMKYIPSQFVRHLIADYLEIPAHIKNDREREHIFLSTRKWITNEFSKNIIEVNYLDSNSSKLKTPNKSNQHGRFSAAFELKK